MASLNGNMLNSGPHLVPSIKDDESQNEKCMASSKAALFDTSSPALYCKEVSGLSQSRSVGDSRRRSSGQGSSLLSKLSSYTSLDLEYPTGQAQSLHQKRRSDEITDSSVDETSQAKTDDAKTEIGKNKKRKYKPKKKYKEGSYGVDGAVNKPKRPLSAYNFFFREERARIIKGESPGGKQGDEVPKAPNVNRVYPEHKQPHRKITFEKLGKLIASRWKGLDDETRASYHDMAEEDSKRYRADMKSWYESENEKRRSRYFPSIAGGNGNSIQQHAPAALGFMSPSSVMGSQDTMASLPMQNPFPTQGNHAAHAHQQMKYGQNAQLLNQFFGTNNTSQNMFQDTPANGYGNQSGSGGAMEINCPQMKNSMGATSAQNSQESRGFLPMGSNNMRNGSAMMSAQQTPKRQSPAQNQVQSQGNSPEQQLLQMLMASQEQKAATPSPQSQNNGLDVNTLLSQFMASKTPQQQHQNEIMFADGKNYPTQRVGVQGGYQSPPNNIFEDLHNRNTNNNNYNNNKILQMAKQENSDHMSKRMMNCNRNSILQMVNQETYGKMEQFFTSNSGHNNNHVQVAKLEINNNMAQILMQLAPMFSNANNNGTINPMN